MGQWVKASTYYSLNMLVVHHELLPDSYLLLLAPGTPDASEAELTHWLKRARRSGKPAVWVDCSLLTSLSAEAARQLRAAHARLRHQHAELVLVHVPTQVEETWFSRPSGPCIVPTLLDAARQHH